MQADFFQKYKTGARQKEQRKEKKEIDCKTTMIIIKRELKYYYRG